MLLIYFFCTYLQIQLYTQALFISPLDTIKSSMQERLKYSDNRVQRGTYICNCITITTCKYVEELYEV